MVFFILIFLFNTACNTARQENQPAPEFTTMEWLNGAPLKIRSLKGSVILLRWWTNDCELCKNSASALNEFYSMYKDSGLIIIGLYHPKPEPRWVSKNEVSAYVAEKSFLFPIAIDAEWKNLRKFWLDKGPKNFTSVSFLIDKKGFIQYIHPGGEYHKEVMVNHESCREDFHTIHSKIKELLHQ